MCYSPWYLQDWQLKLMMEQQQWIDKRMFFLTPQVIGAEWSHSWHQHSHCCDWAVYCSDEAHGNHSYCQVGQSENALVVVCSSLPATLNWLANAWLYKYVDVYSSAFVPFYFVHPNHCCWKPAELLFLSLLVCGCVQVIRELTSAQEKFRVLALPAHLGVI